VTYRTLRLQALLHRLTDTPSAFSQGTKIATELLPRQDSSRHHLCHHGNPPAL